MNYANLMQINRKIAKSRPNKPSIKKKGKKTRRKRYALPNNFDLDAFYRDINKVQIEGKAITISVPETECITVENILKDIGLKFDKRNKSAKKSKPTIKYKIHPPERTQEDEDFNCENFDDELAENGEIFFG